jgi:hypothetical protein
MMLQLASRSQFSQQGELLQDALSYRSPGVGDQIDTFNIQHFALTTAISKPLIPYAHWQNTLGMPVATGACEQERRAMQNRKHKRLALSKIGGWGMRAAIVLAKALHYGRAAQRDERNGFHYTAAMEWRYAAELFESGSLAADYCWGQWERIMHLPRQLAGPVSGSRCVIVPLDSTSARPAMKRRRDSNPRPFGRNTHQNIHRKNTRVSITRRAKANRDNP